MSQEIFLLTWGSSIVTIISIYILFLSHPMNHEVYLLKNEQLFCQWSPKMWGLYYYPWSRKFYPWSKTQLKSQKSNRLYIKIPNHLWMNISMRIWARDHPITSFIYSPSFTPSHHPPPPLKHLVHIHISIMINRS